MANVTGNQEYKSDVFSVLMQDKRRAMEAYNAINGTALKMSDIAGLHVFCGSGQIL